MDTVLNRRSFLRGTSALALFAAAQADFLAQVVTAAGTDNVIAATSAGKVRGLALDDVKVFKGIPYAGTTAGKNRFMPPTKPVNWKGVRDELPSVSRAVQAGASAFVYRFDWETPEGGGHMRSPHTAEIPFYSKTSESRVNSSPRWLKRILSPKRSVRAGRRLRAQGIPIRRSFRTGLLTPLRIETPCYSTTNAMWSRTLHDPRGSRWSGC